MTELERVAQKAEEFGVTVEWARRAKMSYLRTCEQWVINKLLDLDKTKPAWLSGANQKLYDYNFEYWKKRLVGFKARRKNLKMKTASVPTERRGFNKLNVEQAREYPIEQLLDTEVRGGRLPCPFHDDKHPSAGIKNNKLHCFVCNKTWNPIDYLIEKEGLSFSNAVQRLS